MLDIQLLRTQLETVAQALATRKFVLDTSAFQALEDERKFVQTRTQELQAKRNSLSKQIGMLKSKGEDASAVMAEVSGLGDELKSAEERLTALQEKMTDFLQRIPNMPHASVPVGVDESGNVEVRRVGTPKSFDFEVKDHVDVGAALGLDFETGTKLSGSRFTFMRGQMARLHRAIAQFMLDVQTTQHGYTECYTPYIVNADSLLGTGQLPKFEADLFAANKGGQEGEGETLYLIPTSEVTLTNTVRGEVLAADALPLKLTAHTPCFRSEAGSYGRDTRGADSLQRTNSTRSRWCRSFILKLRMLRSMRWSGMPRSYCRNSACRIASWRYAPVIWVSVRPRPMILKSGYLHKTLIARFPPCPIAKPSRRVACRLVSRTNKARTSSCIRTNGSGLAVGRTLVAVLENYQQADGSVIIPDVLLPYMAGLERLSAKN